MINVYHVQMEILQLLLTKLLKWHVLHIILHKLEYNKKYLQEKKFYKYQLTFELVFTINQDCVLKLFKRVDNNNDNFQKVYFITVYIRPLTKIPFFLFNSWTAVSIYFFKVIIKKLQF